MCNLYQTYIDVLNVCLTHLKLAHRVPNVCRMRRTYLYFTGRVSAIIPRLYPAKKFCTDKFCLDKEWLQFILYIFVVKEIIVLQGSLAILFAFKVLRGHSPYDI